MIYKYTLKYKKYTHRTKLKSMLLKTKIMFYQIKTQIDVISSCIQGVHSVPGKRPFLKDEKGEDKLLQTHTFSQSTTT